ncbi:Hypothetical protein CINCED_3A008973 [Cinara cedri]|uniref:Uncharacterized protein n=1 Tax=Cinara cedri TaxID=506608 RepID=A0A5E4N589_9HEMI|nr:Hypothetical protein CINCED_3A008973 [Cinara cedri]
MKSQNFVIFPLFCVLLFCVLSINSQQAPPCSPGCFPKLITETPSICSNGQPATPEGEFCECCPPPPLYPQTGPSPDLPPGRDPPPF